MKILGKNIKQRTYISKSLIYIFLKKYWFQKKKGKINIFEIYQRL